MIHGGAQENTLLTIQGLKRDTLWDLHLVYGPEIEGEGSLVDEACSLGITLRPLQSLRRNIHPWHDIRGYEELLNYFRAEHFDLVHTHSSKAGVLGRMAARQAGVPCVVHTIHGLAFDEFQPAWKNRIFTTAEQVAAEHCDVMIAVCRTMAERAIAAGIGNRSMIRTIYSGFPLDQFLNVKLRPQNGRFVIGMIARMFQLKGHEDLMSLAPALLRTWNDVEFLIVGDGPMRKTWDTWLGSHPEWEKYFRFTGRVASHEIPSQIEQMDMVLHLSRREGLARVIPQALTAARPVCVYDVGGAAEIVENGKTGWMVAPGNLEKVIECIRSIRTNRSLTQEMAFAGRERMQKLFAVEAMQSEILGLYRELMAIRPS